MRPAFVIGNGRSRIGFDLKRLNIAGVTYGSNAIHRDVAVNYLVACDKTMLKEIKITKDLGYNYICIWESDWHRGINALRVIQRKFRET